MDYTANPTFIATTTPTRSWYRVSQITGVSPDVLEIVLDFLPNLEVATTLADQYTILGKAI